MSILNQKQNLIYVMSDTLRTSYMGCYGNRKIHTPNLDAFATESAVFDCAYPESLPTIPARRALHTGRRAYPFCNYKPIKWDIVYLPGWQPMDNNEDTLAENLVNIGYYTGFVTDTLPYFAPGMNFTRGFWQWEFIRGQQQDKWRSPATASLKALAKYNDPEKIMQGFPKNLVLRHIANTAHIHSEEDTTTAKVFRWAMNFIEDNRHIQPFFLMIDCFDPHEPWEAPDSYLEMYAKPGYKGKTIVHTRYGSAEGVYTTEEIEHIKAHYSGLVTLVDTWFGYFINKLKRLGLWENSVIIFLSDHGTNFADNPEGIIGKPHYSLYPGVMHIPLIVHFPNGEGAGQRFNQLIYNIDVTATLYECAGIDIHSRVNVHGQNLYSLVEQGEWIEREYLTSRYGDTLWYRDKKHWVIINVSGEPRAVFDVQKDPNCRNNIVSNAKDIVKKAWKYILYDADGDLPVYKKVKQTDAIGQKRNF